jgi:hypothetical protein
VPCKRVFRRDQSNRVPMKHPTTVPFVNPTKTLDSHAIANAERNSRASREKNTSAVLHTTSEHVNSADPTSRDVFLVPRTSHEDHRHMDTANRPRVEQGTTRGSMTTLSGLRQTVGLDTSDSVTSNVPKSFRCQRRSGIDGARVGSCHRATSRLFRWEGGQFLSPSGIAFGLERNVFHRRTAGGAATLDNHPALKLHPRRRTGCRPGESPCGESKKS